MRGSVAEISGQKPTLHALNPVIPARAIAFGLLTPSPHQGEAFKCDSPSYRRRPVSTSAVGPGLRREDEKGVRTTGARDRLPEWPPRPPGCFCSTFAAIRISPVAAAPAPGYHEGPHHTIRIWQHCRCDSRNTEDPAYASRSQTHDARGRGHRRMGAVRVAQLERILRPDALDRHPRQLHGRTADECSATGIRLQLTTTGRPIGEMDMMIAAVGIPRSLLSQWRARSYTKAR